VVAIRNKEMSGLEESMQVLKESNLIQHNKIVDLEKQLADKAA
jgi:hypothetical protein